MSFLIDGCGIDIPKNILREVQSHVCGSKYDAILYGGMMIENNIAILRYENAKIQNPTKKCVDFFYSKGYV